MRMNLVGEERRPQQLKDNGDLDGARSDRADTHDTSVRVRPDARKASGDQKQPPYPCASDIWLARALPARRNDDQHRELFAGECQLSARQVGGVDSWDAHLRWVCGVPSRSSVAGDPQPQRRRTRAVGVFSLPRTPRRFLIGGMLVGACTRGVHEAARGGTFDWQRTVLIVVVGVVVAVVIDRGPSSLLIRPVRSGSRAIARIGRRARSFAEISVAKGWRNADRVLSLA